MSSPEDMFQSSEEMIEDPGPLETDTGQVPGLVDSDSDVEDDDEEPPAVVNESQGPGTGEDMDTDTLTVGTVLGKSE